ncbi:MAG: ComF family protein [Desulfobulbaceae bacterium]|nr:ComF family protein [Desulfobulbaceae bacterium]
MNSIFRKIAGTGRLSWQALADLCFPPSCLSCGMSLQQSAILFCDRCLAKIKFIHKPYCPCCGILFPAGENHLCALCLKKKWHFTRARSVMVYNGTAAKAIMGLKFGGRKAALMTFRRFKEQCTPCRDLVTPDCIIPVPLHSNRLRRRGFNQSLLLAMAFYPEEKKKIMKTALQRRRDTVPQTGLDGASRRRNLRDAFLVQQQQDVCGKNIVLVDDVFTTGTTVNECARALIQAGAARVDVLTLARVAKNW